MSGNREFYYKLTISVRKIIVFSQSGLSVFKREPSTHISALRFYSEEKFLNCRLGFSDGGMRKSEILMFAHRYSQRQKRQSDQRIAELETLLALQKYGQHRLRDWGRLREIAPPGYGLIDFDKM
jgi:hypothetical protein